MPNYDPYMTPGSAVADSLQEILSQKRMDARQAMLDQLTSNRADLDRQNTLSLIKEREDNTASNKMAREALAKDREAQENNRFLEQFGPEQPIVGSDLERIQKIAPSMVEPGQAAAPQFDYEGEADTSAQPTRFYGRPEDRRKYDETQRKQKALDDLMTKIDANGHMRQDPNSPLTMWLAAAEAGLPTPPEHILNPPKKVPGMYFDEATSKTHPFLDEKNQPILVNEGTAPHMVPRPTREPRDPVDHGTYLDRPVMGPDGQPDPHKIITMVNGHPVVQVIPDGFSLGAKPGSRKPIGLPAGAVSAIAKLRAAARPSDPTLGMGGGYVKPEALTALKSSLSSLLYNLPLSPQIKQMAQDILIYTAGTKTNASYLLTSPTDAATKWRRDNGIDQLSADDHQNLLEVVNGLGTVQ